MTDIVAEIKKHYKLDADGFVAPEELLTHADWAARTTLLVVECMRTVYPQGDLVVSSHALFDGGMGLDYNVILRCEPTDTEATYVIFRAGIRCDRFSSTIVSNWVGMKTALTGIFQRRLKGEDMEEGLAAGGGVGVTSGYKH